MTSRVRNYIIAYSFVIAFIASILNIRVVNKLSDADETEKEAKKYMRFVLPAIAMISFFFGCYYIALVIAGGESAGKDKFAGIIYMFIIGGILIIMNATILSGNNLIDLIKGKKFSILGMFMALGVSSIVFGFLDNFGMKLGTEALDSNFLQAFLGPFSQDTRFLSHEKNITKNLKIMNKWVAGDWRKVVNHTLRYQDDIAKIPKFKDLSNALKSFDGVKLDIPKDVLINSEITDQYVDNIRHKFDIIDGSKAMLGNTFSDFIGALLGAGIISLFMYMTVYDGTIVSRENEDSPFVKYLGYYAPVMEAFFIAFGCLVPVFLNIAMSRMDGNKSNFWCWVIVISVLIAVIIMMFFSVHGIEDMTLDDKKFSVKRTLEGLVERIDLSADNGINEKAFADKVNGFIDGIDA
jgi:hypothetical protein